MPMADGRFAQLPAQQDGAVFNLAGKIEQADIQIFHLHAGGINLGERIFYGLHRFVALALAATQRNDIDHRSAIDEDALAHLLQLSLEGNDGLLALHSAAQQRLQHWNQRLRFLQGKSAVRHGDLLDFQHAVEGNACPMFIGILDDDAIHHAIVRQILQRPAQMLRRNAKHGGAQAA